MAMFTESNIPPSSNQAYTTVQCRTCNYICFIACFYVFPHNNQETNCHTATQKNVRRSAIRMLLHALIWKCLVIPDTCYLFASISALAIFKELILYCLPEIRVVLEASILLLVLTSLAHLYWCLMEYVMWAALAAIYQSY